jgi:hypothetical protein
MLFCAIGGSGYETVEDAGQSQSIGNVSRIT